MKKSTKLLSVILAIIMIFSSMSVAAFAAKTEYQTVQNLKDLGAYNDYGTVTRLSTEERMSIVLDALDGLLAPMTSLNMGKVIDNIMGLNLEINLTSVDNLCATIDNVKSLKSNSTYKFAAVFVDLGIVEDLNMDGWTAGKNRSGAQLDIIGNLLNLITTNKSLVNDVLKNGLKLGMIVNFIEGINLVPINKMITDLPGTIKGLIFPLLTRPDDTAAERTTYTNTAGNGGILSVLDSFVQGLFTKPMNWTSYRTDEYGNDLGDTVALPTSNNTSRYFEINGDEITQYDYAYKNDDATLVGTWVPTVTYTKTLETEGGTTYVYRAPEGYTGDQTLKYYSAGDKGYFLPSVRDAVASGSLSYGLNTDTDSAVSMLYKFIPYVFSEMAPTVLNGSVKKLLAGLFDVTFEKVGDKDSDEVLALAASTGDPESFFTKDQEYYLWEYSDYKVIDDVPYYRFQDEYFVGTIPQNISSYYYMFNWDWKVTGDFMNKYIPHVDGTSVSASDAGYSTVFEALNTFVYDVIDLALVDSFTLNGKTYDVKYGMGWQDGDNSYTLNNILTAARYVFNMAPAEIFDEYYNDPEFSPYYDMMMNGTLKQAVTGIACAAVKMLMPTAILPKADKLCATVGVDSDDDVPFIALGAIVVRELATQLMPGYNFDALIYTDYNTKTILCGAGYDSNYWLDTVLSMGVDLGIYYLRNITDIGEDDSANGYYSVMNKLGATPTADAAAMTYGAGATYVGDVPAWQYKIDWVIDWALTSDVEWGWNIGKLLDCGSTVSLSTYENPWNKLNTILLGLLPFNQLLNDSGATTPSGTFLENILRDKLVGSILTLDLPNLVSMVNIPDGIFRNGNILTQVVTLVRGLLNKVLYKVAGNVELIPSSVTTVDQVLVQDTIVSVATTLVGQLKTAFDNGLLTTALPFVNMFLGWSTAAQKYAEPDIYFSSSSGDNYLLKTSTNVIKFVNKSSGMLETHRNSSLEDSGYNINVTNVTCDNGVTAAGFPTSVAPGATADIALTTPDGAGVTKVTITYSYTGKDGQALGGEQQKVTYAYFTTQNDQENETVAAVDTGDYATRGQYNSYNFTKDILEAVPSFLGNITFKPATVETIFATKSINFQSITGPDQNQNMNTLASNAFAYITNQTEGGWAGTMYSPSQNKEPVSCGGKLYKVKDGVTTEMYNEENSELNGLYGLYDLGQIAVKYGKKSATWAPDFIYYNDYNIGDIMTKYVGYNLQSSDFTAEGQSAYTTYENALRTVVELTETPKLTTYVDVVQPQIKGAIEALDTAYEALVTYKTSASASAAGAEVAGIKDALDAIETDPAKDIDFEDYELFEYFQYEKQRTSARNMIKSSQAPEAPVSYINGSSLTPDAIAAVKAANSATVATAIEATVVQPSQEAMDNWQTSVAEWVAPTYSDLQIADQTSKLTYYGNFMLNNPRNPIYKDFLNTEIVAAKAQGYDGTYYSTDSWTAYTDALANAEEVYASSDAKQSEVFDAKYTLMEAQNNLIPATASMKQDGYYDVELNALIAQAETILANYNTYFGLVEGGTVTEADALAQLIKALGVRYDVTVDGVQYQGILYDHSAYTFVDYDRMSTIKEKAKVDAACDTLKAAMANFECTIKVVPNDATVDNKTSVKQNDYVIEGVEPAAITSVEDLMAKVKASTNEGILIPTASLTIDATPVYGTGSKVVLTVAALADPIATYTLIIHGDVNGDSVVDAFDALEVEKASAGNGKLGGAYKTAGDINADDKFTVDDYGAILSSSVGASVLDQVTA